MTSRFNLPEVNFSDITPESIEEIMVAKFESLMNNEVVLDEADPRRKFLQSITYTLAIMANNIDFTGKQSLLSYAVDDFLDHLGASKNIPRLAATHAKTTVRFKSNAPKQFTVAAGTLVSVNDIYFESINETIVPQGETTVDIAFKATVAGAESNGFLPGQIKDLVEPDAVPYVYDVQNITTSDAGSDIEDDDAYAERIQLAPEGYSVAGPAGAYEFFARKASSEIIDVKAKRTNPGEVTVYVLCEGGESPSEEVKKQVLLQLNADENVPLTDLILVASPEMVEYNLDVSYQSANLADAQTIEKRANEALQDYMLWQKSKLGNGIDPSELYARLQAVGAKRITINPNIYTKIEKHQIAREGVITLNYGGVVDD